MKTLYLLLLFLIKSVCINAQIENALYFDGIDDNVTVTNASALISNSSQISMSCWVYPENFVSTFPDYDGFCGFRNNIDADFYSVKHLNTTETIDILGELD